MATLELKTSGSTGFLKEYKVSRKYLLRPDRARGVPGLRTAVDLANNPLLIKTWPRDPKTEDADLRDIWRNEIRQLHRLAAHAGAENHICELSNSGEDPAGFHIVLNAGQRVPLELLLTRQKTDPWISAPVTLGDRAIVWQNLRRIAGALSTLHSQGLLHRNLNRWSILTAGHEEPDFQLTGFEWSMRLVGDESITRTKLNVMVRDTTLESFFRDWQQLGDIGCILFNVDQKRIGDRSIQHHEVTPALVAEETKLIRELMQITPTPRIDGDFVIEKIDQILTNLSARAKNQEPKYQLVLTLGGASKLSVAVREAAGRTIEIDDTTSQIAFIRDDLSGPAFATSIKIAYQPDRFKLILVGRHLTYHIDDFKIGPARNPSNWDFALCDRADQFQPQQNHVIRQIRIESAQLELLPIAEALSRYPRLRGRVHSWENLRRKLVSPPPRDTPIERTRNSLWLCQILEYLFAAADAFPVKVVPFDTGDRDEAGRTRIYLRGRHDAEREALSKSLGLKDPPAKRMRDALFGEQVSEEATWTLTDGPRLGDKSPGNTEWRFVAEQIDSEGLPLYCFIGEKGAPRIQDGFLIPAGSIGRDSQLRRRFKCLKVLSEHTELAQMLSDPRRRILRSEETLEEDAEYKDLDASKQSAMSLLTETIPLFMVQGPPGVGKTRLVRDLVRRRFRLDPSTRMLLSAQSNYAVDHLLAEVEKILDVSRQPVPLIIRCRPKDKREETGRFDIGTQGQRLLASLADSELVRSARDHLRDRVYRLKSSYVSDAESDDDGAPQKPDYDRQAFEGLILRSANVVFATTNSAELERLIDDKGLFDWSIVEEAGKATGGELIAPLLLSHRRLMIGDHKQLPPFGSERIIRLLDDPSMVREAMKIGDPMIGRAFRDTAIDELIDQDEKDDEISLARLNELCADAGRSLFLFETMIEDEFARHERGQLSKPIAKKLNLQHRMHPAIAELVSTAFYGRDLHTHEDCEKRFSRGRSPVDSIDTNRLPNSPIVWIDMPWVQNTIGMKVGDQTPIWNNPHEVLAIQHVLGLLRTGSNASLAVMSPYSQQVKRIQAAIDVHIDGQFRHLAAFSSASSDGGLVHSVDSFQGREADVVVVSLVRNNSHGWISSALGFLGDARRMNVLFSRARWKLIIVGSLDFLDSVRHLPKGPEDMARIHFLKLLLDGLRSAASSDFAKVVRFADLCGRQS